MGVVTGGVVSMYILGCVTLCVDGVAEEVSFGRLSFGNDGGTIIFSIFAMSMNALVYALPYVKLGMFNLGVERILNMSTPVYWRYIFGVVFGMGICCEKKLDLVCISYAPCFCNKTNYFQLFF